MNAIAEQAEIGAYRLVRRIGAGGMGEVWLAEHRSLGRQAAIKVLHPELSNRSEIVTRFFNEARAVTAISDPGIVQVFDFGHHSDGSAFIVMELLDGEPLDKRLHRLGRLPVGDALRIMRQVATSLGAAHARGIIHRDLKPENIFMVPDAEVAGGDRAKILDFGIAKLAGTQTVKTQTAAVMGTPTYMSPEQCRGAGLVDQRSDIYAVGCVLFALLTGRPPFDAEGVGEIIVMHLTQPAPLPSSRVGGISAEVDQIVARCLAKDPAQRFASAAELARAIGALLGVTSSVPATQAIAHDSSIDRASALPTTLSGAAGVSTPPVKRSRSWMFGVVGVTAIGAVATWLAIRPGSTDVIANAPTSTPHPAPPAAPTTAATPTAKSDPDAMLAVRMTEVLARFVVWSKDHVGAPCPGAIELGGYTTDPWGHPIEITCTDQPANQIVGAISAGPDGAIGTTDDVASWQLARSVTDSVRGTRWPPQLASKPSAVTVKHATKKPPKKSVEPIAAPLPPTEPPKPGNRVVVDENGMPINR